MKPFLITGILDLAKKARSNGRRFNPLFEGDAGLGKSEICQAWVKTQRETDPNFGFIDLRLAVLEAPDLVGLPKVVEKDGETRTSHIQPEFWPTGGSGLLLLEEPNRAKSSEMNAIMQLLTDRKVHNYKLPDGWVIAACINPDVGYDVNTMDPALRDRFVIHEVNYDHNTFVKFMKENNWDPKVVSFVESGIWVFKSHSEIGETGRYISPRTFSRLNDAEQSGVSEMDSEVYFETITAILGKNVGREYHKFVTDQKPVLAADLLAKGKKKQQAMDKLKTYSNPDNYKGDLVSVTLKSLTDGLEDGSVSEELIAEVAVVIPADQTVALLNSTMVILGTKAQKKGKDVIRLPQFLEKFPEVKTYIKSNLSALKKEELLKDQKSA